MTAGKAYLPLYMRSTIFSDEDVALFRAANPEFDIPDGSCDPHLDEVPRPAVCRCR